METNFQVPNPEELLQSSFFSIPLSPEPRSSGTTGQLVILFTIITFVAYLIYSFISYSRYDVQDFDDTRVTWLNTDDPVHPSHAAIILSFTVRETSELYENVDLYLRLRGSIGDSPLLMYQT